MEAYKVGGSFTPYAIVAVEKRFTDAEMAAEVIDAHYALDMDWVQTGEENKRMRHFTEVLTKFAILPHYDQEATNGV
jgi:hypothetical protein